jgi:hypothetical protein
MNIAPGIVRSRDGKNYFEAARSSLLGISLTHFYAPRILKFRDALSPKAIAVFIFWRNNFFYHDGAFHL